MQHKISISATQSESGSGSGSTISGTTFNAGSVAVSIDQVLGVGTDVAVACGFTVANLQSVVMLASKDAMIEVNDGTSPTSTINLLAGSPLVWNGDYFDNPFTGTTTVSTLYVTTTASTRLQVLVISN